MKSSVLIASAWWLVSFLPAHARAQQPSLEGAWQVVERSYVRGDSAWVEPSPRPGLYLFSETRYAVQEIRESGPREQFDERTSDADRLVAFDVFHAHAGRYRASPTELEVTPSIAKSPNTMSGSSYTYGLRISGDTLVITRETPGELRVTTLRRLE